MLSFIELATVQYASGSDDEIKDFCRPRRQEFLDPRRWVVKEVIGRPGEVNPAVFDKDDLVGHPAGKFHVVSHHN